MVMYLFLIPYPPPYAGPEVMAKEILDSKTISNRKVLSSLILILGNQTPIKVNLIYLVY